MRILFNNEPFESHHYCGVNKFFGLLINRLYKTQTILQPYYAKNIFIDKNKFPNSIIYQDKNFYRHNKKLKLLTFLAHKFALTKRISDHFIDRNKKILSQRLRKNNFDIIHIDFCESPSKKIINRIIKNVRKPIVVMVHDVMTPDNWPNNENYCGTAHFSESKLKLLTAATKIVTISNTSKQDLIKIFHIAENKISIVNCCYQKLASNPCEAKLPNKYILYVGKKSGHKNFNFFVDSIKNILLADREIKLIFTFHNVEDFEDWYFNSHLRGLEIADSFICIKAHNEQFLAYLYENALCCAVPSHYEGFGMITLEAMNYGCPVVASNIGATREVAADAAQYFDPRNQQSIADAITKVIYDDNLRAEMSRKGYERAKIFTLENTVESLLKAYQEALKEVRPSEIKYY